MNTWYGSEDSEALTGVSFAGWCLVGVRLLGLAPIVLSGLLLSVLLRGLERPIFVQNRPVTPYITVAVCRFALRIIGLPCRVTGTPMRSPGAFVANHSSWLDIFVLNSCARVYFVSKAEVSAWPLIGWLARATGTVFIRRSRQDAAQQTEMFRARLRNGHRLLFFPEGTSTDGLRVLPFKSSLFEAFFASDDACTDLWIQPVSVTFFAPSQRPAAFYGWWGDMEFATHFIKTLSVWRHGRVELCFNAPRRVADFSSRKDLAVTLEADIRNTQERALSLARAARE
ncbi:1-acyl-sn-glycerol-3-phosphate acyltransferase [Paracoccaceae bacterium]|nr:1-acyl-sn-glycerol-3-phosphate acyltransferase [Paracoccaceae bacterium]